MFHETLSRVLRMQQYKVCFMLSSTLEKSIRAGEVRATPSFAVDPDYRAV